MEAFGADAEQPIERRRQHVLAGVLLHVIEAPRPVDLAADDLAGLQGSGDDVRDRAVLAIDHVGHRRAAERAGIERLAA